MFIERNATPAPSSVDTPFLFSVDEMQRCVEILKEDGVYVFNEKLPENLVNKLQRALNELPAYLRTQDGTEVSFRPLTDKYGLFDFREHDLMSHPVIQEYVTDSTWHIIAGRYFGAPPVLDETVAWWSFPQSSELASLSAQLFHSDRRRLSFVKFFVYLTDVTAKNGPHVVIPKSHRKRPLGLRADRRYEDAEVIGGCGNVSLEVLGKAGTVIAVDTQALHKGRNIEEQKRLMLEIQFSTDLLGPPSNMLHNEWTTTTKARVKANPRVFQRLHWD